jgi:hypothetical protein
VTTIRVERDCLLVGTAETLRNESSRFRERCGFNISRFPFSRAAAEI